jgi:hypothetical protein
MIEKRRAGGESNLAASEAASMAPLTALVERMM